MTTIKVLCNNFRHGASAAILAQEWHKNFGSCGLSGPEYSSEIG